LYEVEVAVCSQINTKHTNTVWLNVKFFNVKPVSESHNGLNISTEMITIVFHILRCELVTYVKFLLFVTMYEVIGAVSVNVHLGSVVMSVPKQL